MTHGSHVIPGHRRERPTPPPTSPLLPENIRLDGRYLNIRVDFEPTLNKGGRLRCPVDKQLVLAMQRVGADEQDCSIREHIKLKTPVYSFYNGLQDMADDPNHSTDGVMSCRWTFESSLVRNPDVKPRSLVRRGPDMQEQNTNHTRDAVPPNLPSKPLAQTRQTTGQGRRSEWSQASGSQSRRQRERGPNHDPRY